MNILYIGNDIRCYIKIRKICDELNIDEIIFHKNYSGIIDLLEDWIPDIIFIDTPQIHEFKMLKTLLNINQYDTKVIMIIGNNKSDDILDLIQLNDYCFIIKPFENYLMKAMIELYL